VKVAVFGVGAVGGLIASRLALAGVSVSVVARGAQLAAIRQNGLRLRTPDGDRLARPRAVAEAGELGPQDVVVIATKAHSLRGAAPAIARLIGETTVLVPAQNGLPWWYFHREGGPLGDTSLASLDPDGALSRTLPPERVVGCVVYVGAEIAAPGVVDHSSGDRFILGEPDGSASSRLDAVADLFRRAGFEAQTTLRIRDAVWLKLWGNLSMNPVSVLTGATVDRLLDDKSIQAMLLKMMAEAREIAERLGVTFHTQAGERLELARALGAFKTSMLQDFEADRPMEIDALLGAVAELGRRLGIATPTIDVIEALVRVRGQGRVAP
jgi:2-dehydropantoate 2-reductase